MEKRRILIIGSGTAGLVAAYSARETDSDADITVLSDEKYFPYRKPSLSCIVKGIYSKPEKISMFPPQLLESHRIRLILGTKVCEINADERMVRVKGITFQKNYGYDALVLATGGNSYIPPVEGVHLRNVFGFRTFDDAIQISDVVDKNKRAIVVGAGFVALAIAEALFRKSVDTTLIVRSRILRNVIEPELSSYLRKKIREKGLRIILGSEIYEIGGQKKVRNVKVAGQHIRASFVVFVTGVNPCVNLASSAGIGVGKHGIQVDNLMCTTVPEIFAAGDCAETIDLITKKTTYLPIGSIAAQQGKIAGINSAGGIESTDGFLRVQSDNPFGVEVTSIGHGSTMAGKLGIELTVKDIELPLTATKKSPFNNLYPTRTKVSIDQMGKIIGAQMVGSKFSNLNPGAIIMAIRERMTLNQLQKHWTLPIKSMVDFSLSRQMQVSISKREHALWGV